MTGQPRCGGCTLFHRTGFPLCDGVNGRTWPLAPFLAAAPNHPGIETNQLHRYELSGIPEPVADRWATRLGLHPVEIWGWDWVDVALSATDRQYLENGWRQAWLASEHGEASVCAPVALPDHAPHPSTESLTTQHRRSA